MTDTPVKAVDAWLRTFASGDFDSWDQLADPELYMEIHFAPPGLPSGNRGLDVCRSTSRQFWQVMKSFEWAELELHATDDPNLIMGVGKSRAVTTWDAPYANEYAFRVRVRNDRVLEYHEYINPLPVMATFGEVLAATA